MREGEGRGPDEELILLVLARYCNDRVAQARRKTCQDGIPKKGHRDIVVADQERDDAEDEAGDDGKSTSSNGEVLKNI